MGQEQRKAPMTLMHWPWGQRLSLMVHSSMSVGGTHMASDRVKEQPVLSLIPCLPSTHPNELTLAACISTPPFDCLSTHKHPFHHAQSKLMHFCRHMHPPKETCSHYVHDTNTPYTHTVILVQICTHTQTHSDTFLLCVLT